MNNRAFKKVNLVDLSYNLSSKVMKISTESSRLCGSYTWAFLQIELEDDKDLPFITILNTFLHEYIHFIQNLSTIDMNGNDIIDDADLVTSVAYSYGTQNGKSVSITTQTRSQGANSKWCHSIYLNDRQFVTYKLFSLGIFALIVTIPCNCFLINELQINYSLAFW